jgi:hypothetical protein
VVATFCDRKSDGDLELESRRFALFFDRGYNSIISLLTHGSRAIDRKDGRERMKRGDISRRNNNVHSEQNEEEKILLARNQRAIGSRDGDPAIEESLGYANTRAVARLLHLR